MTFNLFSMDTMEKTLLRAPMRALYANCAVSVFMKYFSHTSSTNHQDWYLDVVSIWCFFCV